MNSCHTTKNTQGSAFLPRLVCLSANNSSYNVLHRNVKFTDEHECEQLSHSNQITKINHVDMDTLALEYRITFAGFLFH